MQFRMVKFAIRFAKSLKAKKQKKVLLATIANAKQSDKKHKTTRNKTKKKKKSQIDKIQSKIKKKAKEKTHAQQNLAKQ